MSRLFQNNNFIFSDLNGQKIKQLITCTSDYNNITCLYIKTEDTFWYKIFLDSGLAVIEKNEEYEDEDECFCYYDKVSEFEIFDYKITAIFCEPFKNYCKLSIELERDIKLVLEALNPNDCESEIIFRKN